MQAQGINIKLMADIVEVQRRFADVERLAERTANNIGASFAGLGAKLAGALSVGALAAWTKQVIDSIDQLNDLADATGASIENISKLEGAALRTGASLADVGGMLVKFNSALKDAKDQNGAALALQAIGVQAEALRQMDPADAVLTTARALAQFEDDGNKARIVQELFGKSAREVAPLLKDLAEAGELNATVTAQQAQEAEAFNKQLAGLQAQATLASRQIVGGLLPVMTAIVGAFSNGSKEGASFKGVVEFLRVPLEAVAIAGANVWFVLESVGREIGAVAAQIAALGRGDFQAFSAISDMVKADGVRARAELDALQQRILNAGRESQAVTTQAQTDARAALPDIVALGAAAKKSAEDAKAAEKARQDERDAASKRHLAYLKRIDEAEAEAEKKAQEYFKAEADRRKSELDQLATRELRAVQAYEEEEAAIDKRLKSAADMVAAIEHETATLQMSNTEREVSNALLELERQGLVKGSYAYEEYAQNIRKAIVDREAVRESVQQVKTIRDEWQRMANQIEQSITDALMRGFESGKGFVENLRDTLVNTFKTMVLRPTVQAILAPVSGAMASVYSPGAVAGQAGTMQSAGMLQTMTQVYGAVKAGFTAIGDSVAFAAQDAGAWLMQHTTGALNKLGGQMMSSSGALGSAAGYGAGLAAGHYVGRAISGDYGSNATVNIATIAGAVIGGPIGAAIGGVIGGLANRAFGMGNKQVTGQGIRGTFAGDSFSGSQYATMLQKGGWFRSDRNWTETSGLDAGTQQALSQGFASIKAATASLASGLGGSALAVKLYSQQINLALTSDAEKNKEIITKLFTDMGDTLARIAVPSIDKFRHENETAAAALQRLSTDLTAVNRVLDTLGQTAFRLNVFGADAASSLVQMFGGMEALNSATSAYYEAFYGEAERLDTTARQLAQAFAAAGMTNAPQSLAEYRALIEAQDLMTEAGRQQYTMLMRLAPAFASLEKAGQAVTAASREAAQAAASEAKAKREALVAAGQRLSEWLASLRMANASAAVSLGMARADYLKNLTLARGNDATALANVSGSAETYISAARGQARSTAEFRAIVAQVSTEVGNLPAVKTYQQEQLELMREWLVAIGAVRTGLGGDIAGLTLLTSDGFTTLDTTANGLLSYDELTKGLAGMATDEQIKKLIESVDLNGDGQLSELELATQKQGAIQKATEDTYTAAIEQIRALVAINDSGLIAIGTNTSNAIPYLNNIQEYLKSINTKTVTPTTTTTQPTVTTLPVKTGGSVGDSIAKTFVKLLPWADGGVFGGPGIYNQPTFFGANGNLNVMGEAGPEAVMPLERMSDGALGVRAQIYAAPMSQPERTAADPALLAELRALRAEVADLRAEARSTAVATNKTARILDRVTPDGNSLQTTAAA